ILDQLQVGLKELLNKEDDVAIVERDQSTYRDNLEEAMVQVAGEDFRKVISFGDAPFANASGASELNYPTLDDVKQPQQGRGSRNLMNRVSSACPRFPAQTMPRHIVQCNRERQDLQYEEQTFTCTSLLLLDLCCAAFTPANKTDKEYYKKVDARCERLGITRRQFFFVNYMFFLQQLKLWNMMHPGEPFPFMSASLMTHLHWLGNIGCTTTSLVYYCGNAWHPEVFWRHFTAAMPIELVQEMNDIFGRFYPLIREVDITIEDGALTTAVGDWDGDVTPDTREEMRLAKWRGNSKGGKKSGGMHQEAAFNFHTAREDGADEEEALECVRAYLSDKHYNMYLGSLKGGALNGTAVVFDRVFEELKKTHKDLGDDAFNPLVTDLIVAQMDIDERKRYNWLLEFYKKDKLLEKLSAFGDLSNKTKKRIREKTTRKSRSEANKQGAATKGHKAGVDWSLAQERMVWEIHKGEKYKTESLVRPLIIWPQVLEKEGHLFPNMTASDMKVKLGNLKKQEKIGMLPF
ncbi:hypothetical protein N9140_00265, partial [bacterium]|nr:hypothetical protein [bacterium]